jgi:H/ACA ribonucleoprotein complex subunit 4
VARKWRERKIYFFDILEIQDKDVLFKVGCEAGTYIRKLAHDVGQRLGVGAHLTELRRTKFGPFDERGSCSLLAVKDAYEFWRENGDERQLRKILQQIEHAVLHVKHVFVKDSAIAAVCNGAPVFASGLTRIQKGIEPGELVAVSSLKEELVAFGIAKMSSEEMFKRKKGTAVRTDRVFMQGVYPKISAEK